MYFCIARKPDSKPPVMTMTGGLLSTVEYVASGIGTATPTQGHIRAHCQNCRSLVHLNL